MLFDPFDRLEFIEHCTMEFVGAAISRPRATTGRPYIHTTTLCIYFQNSSLIVVRYSSSIS